MDISETFIAMCDCEEIQEWAQYGNYNFFVCALTKELRLSHLDDYNYMKSMNMLQKEREYIWLPRQDQIQEMYFNNAYPCTIITKFYKWFDRTIEKLIENCEGLDWSMEKLWLSYFMHEKHSKIWSEGKWVKK